MCYFLPAIAGIKQMLDPNGILNPYKMLPRE
jgi:FAD/FMN-containing dehydrogenase